MSSILETTLVRRRKRARKWRILLLSCSIGTVCPGGQRGQAAVDRWRHHVHPGHGSQTVRVIGAQDPKLGGFF
jgi:hypothetical protein